VIVAAEVIAINVVNTVCVIVKHLELIVAFDLAIVGLHFIPLAWLFRVPRYHLTALLFCGISVLTLLLIPAKAQVGHTLAWYVVPSLGCAAVAWLTAVASFREAWQLIGVDRASQRAISS